MPSTRRAKVPQKNIFDFLPDAFYSSIGLCYLFAFLSLLSQWSGLYGYNGLLPVDSFLSLILNHFRGESSKWNLFLKVPSLYLLFLDSPIISGQVEGISMFLLAIGAISATGLVIGQHSKLLFLVCWISYLSLFTVGQTFLSFQWDILLLETGFLCILSAPNFFFTITNRNDVDGNHKVVWVPGVWWRWCFRFLAFKLMFLSGVVKLEAQCPTWEKLSALEYHFATQCIPNPLAWFAHQLPPIVLRFAVAATLLIEIPFAFLLIFPLTGIRRFGVVLQIILQISIIFTGNYNFFNLLTMSLFLVSWLEDHEEEGKKNVDKKSVKDNENEMVRMGHENDSPMNLNREGPFVAYTTLLGYLNSSDEVSSPAAMFVSTILQVTFCIAFSVWSFYWMFSLNPVEHWWQGSKITLRPGFWSERLQPLLQTLSIAAVTSTLVHSLCYFFYDLRRLQKRYLSEAGKSSSWVIRLPLLFMRLGTRSTSFAVASIWILLSSTSFNSICDIQPVIPSFVANVYQKSQPFHISSSYGLFRRMTGVGQSLSSSSDGAVVARPEVVLEGLFKPSSTSANNEMKWVEIPFLYKPTDVNKTPKFIAPHQPRLDWQMWFAALSTADRQPWLLHLVYKLLQAKPKQYKGQSKAITGADDVFSLLDKEELLRMTGEPVWPDFKSIRMKLYDYDFTRLPTPWSKHLSKSAVFIDPRSFISSNVTSSSIEGGGEKQ